MYNNLCMNSAIIMFWLGLSAEAVGSARRNVSAVIRALRSLSDLFDQRPPSSTRMLPTVSRLASSVSKAPLTLQQASASLLPPIPLFRGILRAHRRLPTEMRSLGDSYVKSEFRHHRKVDNPLHIIGFLSQWKLYLDQLPADPSQPFTGRKLDPTLVEKMSAEQIGQLYELMHATKDVWKPVSSSAEDPGAADPSREQS